MEKLLVSLFVPAVDGHYDVFLPRDLKVKILTNILADGVADLCNGRYSRSNKEFLVMLEPSSLLNPESCLDDYGVKDGARLALI